MQTDRYDYSPIIRRKPLRWPNNARVALMVAPNIEFIDIPPAIRPNYQYFTEAATTRLRQAGYNAPFTSLEAAVRDCVVNHLAQPDPYL